MGCNCTKRERKKIRRDILILYEETLKYSKEVVEKWWEDLPIKFPDSHKRMEYFIEELCDFLDDFITESIKDKIDILNPEDILKLILAILDINEIYDIIKDVV